jgi:hypothetical protein
MMPTMAYVTARPGGTWEIRESVSTPKGPRSRTLASFRTLTSEIVEQARARAAKPLSPDDVRRAARRAGAPVDLATADKAAGDLLRELANGREPHPILRQLLIDALQAGPPVRLGEPARTFGSRAAAEPLDAHERQAPESLDNARASAAWLTASQAERGDALYDLLLLADQFPPSRSRAEHDGFPRLGRAA